MAGLAVGLVLGCGGALLWRSAPLLGAPLLALAAGSPRWRVLWVGVVAGLALTGTGRAANQPAPGLDRLVLPATHLVRGRVLEASLPSPASPNLLLLEASSIGGHPVHAVRIRMGLEGASKPGPRPGDRIRALARLSRFPPVRNPGAFDRAARWHARGVHLRGWVESAAHVEIVRRSRGPLLTGLHRTRLDAASTLEGRLSAEDAGLARALVLGDRSTVSPADRARFQNTGQGHLIAVSGLHVGLVLATLLFLLRRLGMGTGGVALLGLLAVAFYVPFAGAAPSAVRAGTAVALWLGARLVGRRVSAPSLFAVVVVAVLFGRPGGLADPALTLSLSAVTGLLVLLAPLTRILVPDDIVVPGIVPRRRAPLRRTLAVALAAWLGTAPLLAAVLGRLCPVAALVSVLTVPLTAVLVGASFAAWLGDAVPGLAVAATTVFEGTASVLRALLDAVGAAGLGALPASRPHAAWYPLYGLGWFALARTGRTVGRLALLGLLALLTALLWPAPPPRPPAPRLVLLDVGHGQAGILLLPDGRSALLDAGRMGDPEVGARIVVPALRALGVRHVDLAAVSHGDADHAGGIVDVHRLVPIRRLVAPPSLAARTRARFIAAGLAVSTASRGDVLLEGRWGELRVLAPCRPPAPGASRNDSGLALLLETSDGVRLLLPGDREKDGIERLLAAGPGLRADVLVLPHHGRPGGGRDRLREAVGASWEVASCGASILAHLPPGTRSTAEEGALVADLGPGGPRVRTPWATVSGGYHAAPPMLVTPPPLLTPATAGVAFLLALLAWASVRRFHWLDAPAAAGAWLLGLAAWCAFGAPGIAALLAPFLGASLAGRLPGAPHTGARSLRQVAANGLPALAGAGVALAGWPGIGAAAFVGALAGLGADTAATEIGIRYGGTPRSPVSGARLRRGESGGVTAAGLLASVGGSLLAPLAWLAFAGIDAAALGWLAFAGTAAALLDSVLGATLQYRGRDASTGETTEARQTAAGRTVRTSGLNWLDNDAVNLVAGIAAALLAVALVGAPG